MLHFFGFLIDLWALCPISAFQKGFGLQLSESLIFIALIWNNKVSKLFSWIGMSVGKRLTISGIILISILVVKSCFAFERAEFLRVIIAH